MNILKQLDILYEDNHVLVVLKPPGVPSQPDKSTAPDMLGLLKYHLAIRDHKKGNVWLGLIHRLDRPTSGLMVFAKTSKAASRISKSFRGREVRKYYLARIRGIPDQESGTLCDYLSAREIEGRVRLLSTDSASDPMTVSKRKLSDSADVQLSQKNTWDKLLDPSEEFLSPKLNGEKLTEPSDEFLSPKLNVEKLAEPSDEFLSPKLNVEKLAEPSDEFLSPKLNVEKLAEPSDEFLSPKLNVERLSEPSDELLSPKLNVERLSEPSDEFLSPKLNVEKLAEPSDEFLSPKLNVERLSEPSDEFLSPKLNVERLSEPSDELLLQKLNDEKRQLNDAKIAELRWAVISSMNRHSVNESLLFVELLTGRRHQIRVQFADRGFPILGDRRYGYNDKRDSSVPTLALHACGLIFPHPVRKTTMAFYANPAINPSFCQDDVDAFNLYLTSLIDDGKLSSPTL